MAKTFGVDKTLIGVAHLDACITVVDAANMMQYFRDTT
jgi:G3E family GTPase